VVARDEQEEMFRAKILIPLIKEPRTWQELLEFSGFARGTLAKHLKVLLERGLIVDEIDKNDRRRKIYRMTDEGEEFLRDVLKRQSRRLKKEVEEVLQALLEVDSKSAKQFIQDLKKIVEKV
jgi:DNA-binding MarR family transcriptional regulator